MRYWQPEEGDPVSSFRYKQAMGEVEDLTDAIVGKGIVSGLQLGSSTGLNLSVSSGSAVFSGGLFEFSGGTIALQASQTNYIYLISVFNSVTRTFSASLTGNITGSEPSGSILLGTALTNGSSVLSTTSVYPTTRAVTLKSLEDLSYPDFFPISSTGDLINYINNQQVSGAFLTTADFAAASGNFTLRSYFDDVVGPLAAVSGQIVFRPELLSVSGLLQGRIAQLQSATGAYALKTELTVVDNKFALYVPLSASGQLASTGSVRALIALTGTFLNLAALVAVSGALANTTVVNGLTGNVTIVPSGNLFLAVSGNSIVLYAPDNVGGGGPTFYLNSLTGSVNLVASGDLSLVTSGNNLILYGLNDGDGVETFVNGLTGNVTLVASGGADIGVSGQTILVYAPPATQDTNTITYVNGLTGSVNLVASGSVGVGVSGQSILVYGPPQIQDTNTITLVNGLTGSVTLVPSGGVSIGVSGNNVLIYAPSGSSVDTSSFLTKTEFQPVSGATFVVGLLATYTPTATGYDTLIVPVPYDQRDQASYNKSQTYNLKRLTIACVSTGSVSFICEVHKLSSLPQVGGTSIGGITLASGAYSNVETSGLGNVNSGQFLSLYVTQTHTSNAPTYITLSAEFGL